MAYISDNFVRSNGVIDGKWGPIFPNTAETMLNALSGGILVNGNGYGPISAGGGDAQHELWKLVNGLGTLLAAASAADITLPLIGETILLVAVGTTLIAYRNGLKLFSVTDTDLVSGTPGITSWSMNGSQEYVFANWTTVVNHREITERQLIIFKPLILLTPTFLFWMCL